MPYMDSLFFIIFLFILIIVFGTAAIAGFKAAPFVPTRGKDIKRFLNFGQIKPGQLVYDLGAGDGRLVLALARDYQARVVGFELSLLPYLWAKIKIKFSGLSGRANIVYKDFYQADLSKADAVVCFLTPMAMNKLKPKFEKELKKNAKVVSYAFEIKGWPNRDVSKPQPDDTAIYRHVKT
jgi:SAM-dependent methyltransferase